LEGLGKFRKSSDHIGIRARDFPVCSIEPQSSMLPCFTACNMCICRVCTYVIDQLAFTLSVHHPSYWKLNRVCFYFSTFHSISFYTICWLYWCRSQINWYYKKFQNLWHTVFRFIKTRMNLTLTLNQIDVAYVWKGNGREKWRKICKRT
jgi:hypothetical protein